jgi:antitoxin (DNA-binding transcriptional repressor) of toxin-antitoxin stability system
MQVVSMSKAKSTLSRLVEAIEQGREREIVIARAGRPVARLVALEFDRIGKRIGAAKDVFQVPDSIDACNKEIAERFLEGDGTSR